MGMSARKGRRPFWDMRGLRESSSKKSDCGDDGVDADLEFHVRGQVRDGSGLRRRAKVMKEVQSSSAAQQPGGAQEHRRTKLNRMEKSELGTKLMCGD